MADRMTSGQYRAALATLGLSQNDGARLVGANLRTSQRWALENEGPPPPVSRFLRYLIHIGADPAKVMAILDQGDVAEHDAAT